MSYVVTVVYVALLLWGFLVGARQIHQGYRHPDRLLNPLFANRHALRLFVVHLALSTTFLVVVGPLAIAHKSTLWFWGGVVAVLTTSLPIAAFLNRNPQSFGSFIGVWVKLRNFFEYGVFILVAALAVDWSSYVLLLWWIVAYRFLDVGPRRALQKLYDTPEKKAARPWAQGLNFAVIAGLYGLAYVVVRQGLVLVADVPSAGTPTHDPAAWETATVLVVNLGLAMFAWLATKKYTDSLAAAPGPPVVAAGY